MSDAPGHNHRYPRSLLLILTGALAFTDGGTSAPSAEPQTSCELPPPPSSGPQRTATEYSYLRSFPLDTLPVTVPDHGEEWSIVWCSGSGSREVADVRVTWEPLAPGQDWHASVALGGGRRVYVNAQSDLLGFLLPGDEERQTLWAPSGSHVSTADDEVQAEAAAFAGAAGEGDAPSSTRPLDWSGLTVPDGEVWRIRWRGVSREVGPSYDVRVTAPPGDAPWRANLGEGLEHTLHVDMAGGHIAGLGFASDPLAPAATLRRPPHGTMVSLGHAAVRARVDVFAYGGSPQGEGGGSRACRLPPGLDTDIRLARVLTTSAEPVFVTLDQYGNDRIGPVSAGETVVVVDEAALSACVIQTLSDGGERFGWISLRHLDVRPPEPVSTDAWVGAWHRDGARVTVTQDGPDPSLLVRASAEWEHYVPSDTAGFELVDIHEGGVEGSGQPGERRLVVSQHGCVLTLVLAGGVLLADDNGSCGGMNVRFTGVYNRDPA